MAAALLEPEEGSGEPVEEGTLPPADDYEQHRQEDEVGEQGVAMVEPGGLMLNHQRALSTVSQGNTATTTRSFEGGSMNHPGADGLTLCYPGTMLQCVGKPCW